MVKKALMFLLFPVCLLGQTINIDSSSIGTASRDYSTIQGWENAKDGDLVTADTTRKGVCFNDAVFTEEVTIDGSITSDSTFMWLLAAPGEEHSGVEKTGVRIQPQAWGTPALKLQDDYIRIEKIELDGSATAGGSQDGIYLSSASSNFVNRLLIYDFGGDGIDGGGCEIRNSIVYNSGEDGLKMRLNSIARNISVYNSSNVGIRAYFVGSITVENAISLGNLTDFAESGGAGDFVVINNCLSSDSTADDFGGVNHLVGKTASAQFVDLGTTENLHLKSGADAIDAGKDLSGTFIDDIDGVTRSVPWDIGADEEGPINWIVFEETVSACNASSTSIVSPSVAGGTDMLYIAAIATKPDPDVTSVTGGGLTWTSRVEQCGARGQTLCAIFTAFGSPGSAFTVTANVDVAPVAMSIIVARYSGADVTTAIEDFVGHNTLGENGACSGGTDNSSAQITTGSTNTNSVHFVALNRRNKTLSSSDADYTQRKEQLCDQGSGKASNLTIHDFNKAATGDDVFTATLGGNTDWSVAGLVIIPAAAPPAGSPKRGQVIVIGDE